MNLGNRNGHTDLIAVQDYSPAIAFPPAWASFLRICHSFIQLIEYSHHSLTWTMAKLEIAERNISSY